MAIILFGVIVYAFMCYVLLESTERLCKEKPAKTLPQSQRIRYASIHYYGIHE